MAASTKRTTTNGRVSHSALEHVAEHEAEDERRPRPFEPLHGPAEHAEGGEREEIAPVAPDLIGADEYDHEHAGQHERVAQRRHARELRAEEVAKPRADQVC
jgi:hypothetical protein